MANTEDFVAFALDLLEPVGPVSARRMFGGHGVYARGVMFALLDDDELFLKTDEESRPAFKAAGCRMWVYPGAAMDETSYWRPPDEAHDDPEAMAPWARLGLEAALRKAAAKAKKAVRAKKSAQPKTGTKAKQPANPSRTAAPKKRTPRPKAQRAQKRPLSPRR